MMLKIGKLPIVAFCALNSSAVKAFLAPDQHVDFCDIESDSDLSAVKDLCVKNYQRKMVDSEEIVPKLGLMEEMTINMIEATRRAPCSDLALAIESSQAPGVRSGNSGLNCQDSQCDVAMDLRGIWGYGCWCNFGSHLMNGKGAAASPHDAACKNMQLCLRCAEMDGKHGGYDCNPRVTSYNASLGMPSSSKQNGNVNSINAGCSVQNIGDKCATHVCTCEIQLINDILELVWSGNRHDASPRHPENPFGGSFDVQANCVANPGIAELDCCGRYPERYPFNSLVQSCCDATKQLYNPFDKVCCDDGLRNLGDGAC